MIYFVLGLIVGIGGTYFVMRGISKTNTKESAKETEIKVPEAVEKKAENTVKLKKLITQKTNADKITNDEVQKLLGVSDATAERYLQELESDGVVKQSGEVGKSVFYLKS